MTYYRGCELHWYRGQEPRVWLTYHKLRDKFGYWTDSRHDLCKTPDQILKRFKDWVDVCLRLYYDE